ncbi:MAG: TetR/AcrR family transcriptional regulator [Rhodospirillaceae bacterium]|nr:TetR/AcrR family transcriptional regulator [Rhodospirillaceae bacterium]
MAKGDDTRAAIVAQSLDLATVVGLTGLSIGSLAEHTGMSKSGLFAHFGSKEALQIAVLDAAEEKFIETVLKPATRAPRGLARLRVLFERKLEWDKAGRGGCIFNASVPEFDDRPGPVRERLVEAQRKFRTILLTITDSAVKAGDFPPDFDREQFAHDLTGILLAYGHASRLMQDPQAESRARAAFERLLKLSQTR